MKRQPRKRLIRDRSHPLIKAAGLSAAALAERAGYSLRQTLYALDGRRTCPERVADVLCATLGPDGWRFLCGEADSVTLTRTFQAGAERSRDLAKGGFMSQPINMDAPQGASLLSTTFNTCQHCGAYIDLSDSRWWIYLRRNEPHPLAECEQIRQMKDRLANG